MKTFKTFVSTFVMTSFLATATFAGPNFKLSDYKTVAVAPVLGASNTRGVFESELAAQASGLEFTGDRASASKKASESMSASQSSGFGFAGSATQQDTALLALGSLLGVLPTAMRIDAAQAKQYVAQLEPVVAKLQGAGVNPEIIAALTMALNAAKADDFQTCMKALLTAMITSATSIQKGSERKHGYLAVGLYAGIALAWITAGQQNQAYADLAPPLIALLEEDAAMGGADRNVAAQIKIVATELVSASPNQQAVIGALGALQQVKAD